MYVAPSLFFAVEEHADPAIEAANAQLWVYMTPENLLLGDTDGQHKESYLTHNPFTVSKGFMINVPIYLTELEERIYEQRISRQGGRFYISPSDMTNIPMNEHTEINRNLFRFRIPGAKKPEIRKQLNDAGINRASIYVKENPDHLIWTNAINQKIFGF